MQSIKSHPMKRRSQSSVIPIDMPIQEMEPVRIHSVPSFHYPDMQIDFVDASQCWKEDKRRLSNGCYQYLCQAMLSMGRCCSKVACNESLHDYMADTRTCKQHYKKTS